MVKRLPSLNALRAFDAAARHLSFARAAEELHVTPAAVSQLIKQLEEELGQVLFKRGKTLTLSEPASAALPLLREGFEQLQHAADRLRTGNGAGPLVISTPPTFAARWLIARLDDFQLQHPEIEIRLLATRRLVDFDLEDVDIAVRFGAGPFDGLSAEKLLPEAIIPVASAGLASKITSADDLQSCTLLHDESHDWDSSFPDWAVWLRSLGVKVDNPLRIRHFSDANLVIQAVMSGLGIALVWQSLVSDDLKAGRLVRLLNKSVPTIQSYHLVIPPNRLHLQKVTVFRQWILSQATR